MNPFPQAPTQNLSEQQQLMQILKSNPELMQKYQQQLAKMQSQAKSAHPPMTSQKYLQLLPNIQKYLDPQGGLLIEPKQVFVLKFMQKRTNQKIFVNIVTHPVIDHPEQKLLVDFQNQPGLRIPMSMGKIREDHDKNGGICKVVDVVLNPKIVESAETNVQILSFTAQIIGNYLLQKYKIVVAEDVLKKVKGLKYKGNKVQIQRVKAKKAPKIQQLSQQQKLHQQYKNKKQEQLLNQINDQTLHKPVMRPQFQIFAFVKGIEQYELYSLQTAPYSNLKILFNLPHLIHSKGIHLQGSDSIIYLSVKGIYQICLKIPFKVLKWQAVFSRKERKLKVLVYKQQQDQVKNGRDQKQANNQKQQNTNRNQKQTNNTVVLDNDLLYDLV